MMELLKRFRLQSAHYLPGVAEGDAEGRLHGHNFQVEVRVRGPLDPVMGWVVDFGEIKAAFASVFARLDHQLLNDVQGLEDPRAENIARWIFEELAPELPLLHRVVVCETEERCGSFGPSTAASNAAIAQDQSS
ncbi:MAG: 6-carboxytetrahydropterin synthase QueD [Deltaproteobacteria bacterium]|nr:6-carboxytetrahydropterin synthase QueD [Deltaproteobacteria bacterium]